VGQVGYLHELCRDTRSTKHKILHTTNLCNSHGFSTATIVTGTFLNVTLHPHCLTC